MPILRASLYGPLSLPFCIRRRLLHINLSTCPPNTATVLLSPAFLGLLSTTVIRPPLCLVVSAPSSPQRLPSCPRDVLFADNLPIFSVLQRLLRSHATMRLLSWRVTMFLDPVCPARSPIRQDRYGFPTLPSTRDHVA